MESSAGLLLINFVDQKPWVVKPNISLSIDLEESYNDDNITNLIFLLFELLG